MVKAKKPIIKLTDKVQSRHTKFDLFFKDKNKRIKSIKNINVKLLGKHNALNAAAALIVCLNLGASLNLAKIIKKFFCV